MIKGYIHLLSEQLFVSQVKRYADKYQRNSIIKQWGKKYNLLKKNYNLLIQPDEEVNMKEYKGIIALCLATEKNVIDVQTYNSRENREIIIEQWLEKYSSFENKILNIIPYE